MLFMSLENYLKFINWKLPLAPPKPNELTAAKLPGNFVTSVHTFKRPSINAGISLRGVAKFIFGGTASASNPNSTFVIEQSPELLSLWPIFDFTEPISNGSLRLVQNTRSRVLHSSGSPTFVEKSIYLSIVNELLIIKNDMFFSVPLCQFRELP